MVETATAHSRSPLEGWSITGWVTLALLAMVAAIFALAGTDRPGIHSVVRATAKTSAVIFALTFAASSLHRFWRSAASSWLLRNRRYLGVSVAVSHGLHLIALLASAARWPQPFFERNSRPLVIGVGSLAYLLLFAMAATSSAAAARRLGPWWRRLHLAGSYLMWVIFTYNYVMLSLKTPLSLPFAAVLVGALGLRIAAARARAASAVAFPRQ